MAGRFKRARTEAQLVHEKPRPAYRPPAGADIRRQASELVDVKPAAMERFRKRFPQFTTRL